MVSAPSRYAASQIQDNEAFTSLALLLRFAQFVHEHWDEFTVDPSGT